MSLLDALHAIPFEVWCAIILLALTVGVCGAYLVALFREDAEREQRAADLDRLTPRERRQRILDERARWGHR